VTTYHTREPKSNAWLQSATAQVAVNGLCKTVLYPCNSD
jgi:hypothetical protein